MDSRRPHITVCVCTLNRPVLLEKLLRAIDGQAAEGEFSHSVVVADNDSQESARTTVSKFSALSKTKAVYCAEPRRNIALARNRALTNAEGDFIAFIDDDEYPEPTWLQSMLRACEKYQCAGILGPVRPYFETPPPRWIIDGRFCERPEPPTGHVMDWEESRTGNLLFRRSILERLAEPFNPAFGSGGEDKDFFMRMARKGLVFRWCNEGVAFEVVPPARWKRSFMVRRALLRGKNILKHPDRRIRLIAQSFVAVPIYLVMLPFTLLFGQHIFMKYCIKTCDHLGRILAIFHLNFVSER
jgi:glycosyltransferase involved in cell wall biosynthesis